MVTSLEQIRSIVSNTSGSTAEQAAVRFSWTGTMFKVPFIRPAWFGNRKTSILAGNEQPFCGLCDSFMNRELCALRGENAIVFLTTDY